MRSTPYMSDMHRRDSDARREAELIAGQNRARENARDWIRRANIAASAGLSLLALDLFNQAKLELQNTPWRVDSINDLPSVFPEVQS